MANLYLIWPGIGDFPSLFGLRCSTSLPNWEQPQVNLESSGTPFINTRASMVALADRILIVGGRVTEKFNNSEHEVGTGYCQAWPNMSLINGGNIPGAGTEWSAGLAVWGTGALAVWNGIGSDTRLWCSQYNRAQNIWSSQFVTQLAGTGKPIQSGSAPALVEYGGLLLMVWRGEGSNDNLYYATSQDGRTWRGNEIIAGASSSIQPALAIFNGAPVLCFKGGGNDGGIYSTTYNLHSDSWAPIVATGPFGTSHGPTLAVYEGKLFMAWKGINNDTDLYWSVTSNNLDRNSWSGQANISNVGSQYGPTAVVY